MQQHLMETRIALENQILEAIDQLRKRKARPDADRICNFLLRKYSVDARDTIADLHRLIEAEKVIQVDYKGHTSYRNASKWSRLQLYKNRPEGFVKEKLNSSMVSGAVAELVVEEPDYLDQGVPACRLIEQLLDGVSSPTSRRMVEDFLGKEVACGNLTRLSNGNYSLVATSDITTTPAAAPDAPRRDSTATSSAGAATTTTAAATSAAASLSLENGNTPRRVGKQSNGNNNGSNSNSSNSNSSSNNSSNCSLTAAVMSAATTATTMATTTTTSMGTVLTSAAVAAVTAAAAAAAAAAAELYEFDETDNLTDSRSNTPQSSRQASPKVDRQQQDVKKEECYEIIVGKNDDVRRSVSPPSVEMDGEQDRDLLEIAGLTTAIEEAKESPKCNIVQTPNLKRSTKAERKQRLFARTEDPMDIKFEDDPRDSKEVIDTLKDKREEADRRSSDDREDEEAGRSSTNTSPTPSNANAAGFRSARRKRAKKVFDPSDNNLVKRKRGRQPGSHNKTSLMQESQDSNKPAVKDGPCRQCSLCAKEKQEALVACRDCTVRAHPSCIYSPEEMLQKANSNWQCERCKSCTVCCETSDAGPLVTCFNCDEAYHYCCHTPRITIPKSSSKWYCNDCLQKQYKTNVSQNASSISTNRPDTPSNTPALPPVLSPQVSPARGSSDQMDLDDARDKIDPNIPDASDWTSEQVYQYFARLFPKEAEVFRQQDIDGHSLLLMKRSDVLTGLDLLLGPALKIYRHVLKLQVRRDDPKLYWL